MLNVIIRVLFWYFWVMLISLAGLPLAWRWLRWLPDRGYTFAKPFGLLLWGYFLWVGASIGLLHNNFGGAVAAVALLALLSFFFGKEAWQLDAQGRRPLWAWLQRQWHLVAFTEGLFLLFFIVGLVYRAFTPDIATAGGEKFMEMAFLNGIRTSPVFPPHDPWLAGYSISYYYFGYVIMAGLMTLSGVSTGIGFNIGVATLFALGLSGAFAVTVNLLSKKGAEGSDAIHFPFGWGFLGSLLFGIVSNLEAVFDILYARQWLPYSFWHWLDIKDLNIPAVGPATALPQRFMWWWRASRVINDRDLLGHSMEVIDEFPFFSYILGDMHPHVLALPFVLLTVGLAFNLWRWLSGPEAAVESEKPWYSPSRWWSLAVNWPGGSSGFFFGALAVGSLFFLNTWDAPIYLGLLLSVYVWRRARPHQQFKWSLLVDGALVAVMMGVLSLFFYFPFFIAFQSQAGGLLPNLFNPTRLVQFMVMFAPLLLPVFAFLWLLGRESGWRPTGKAFAEWVIWPLLLPPVIILLLLSLLLLTPAGHDFTQRILSNPEVQKQIGGANWGALLRRIAGLRFAVSGTYLLLALAIGWVLGLLAVKMPKPEEGEEERDTFVLFLIGFAFLLTFGVEFVYLRDLFGTRMNTVFKFYYQGWVLFSLAAVYGLAQVWRRARHTLGGQVWLALSALFILGGLIYPLTAAPNRANNFRGRPTLDGTRWIKQGVPEDAAAARWLQLHAPLDAVVVEATGHSYSYAARLSALTGRPTLLGWDGHESQWRGPAYSAMVGKRPQVIQQIYKIASGTELVQLLAANGVDYVYVGQLERRALGITPADIKRLDRALRLVYKNKETRIYQRPGDPAQ